ncbi:MAG TPA: hypothetical protein VHV29_11055 [Terriglobales bacterium]|nr:hypothetical protein [Terriglobales bacterium]
MSYLETGVRMCLGEKAGAWTPLSAEPAVLYSLVCSGISRKTGIFRVFRWKLRRNFSAVLVEEKVYPDPYTGMNLRSIPGTTYPIFEDFSNVPMPPTSPFRQSW